MIDSRLYRRFGELRLFIDIFKPENDIISCKTEIYHTAKNGDALEFNFYSKYFDGLITKDENYAMSKLFNNDSAGDSLSKTERALLNKWRKLSKWRNYDDRATNYIRDITSKDVISVDLCLAGWCNWDSVSLYEKAERQEVQKNAFKIVEDVKQQVGKLKICTRLVADLCTLINGKHTRAVISALKTGKNQNNPELVSLYTAISKIKNYTEENVKLIDAYEELDKITKSFQGEEIRISQIKTYLQYVS